MRGGGDHEDLRPLTQDGNVDEAVIGCHRGSFEGLNVRSPSAGFRYRHELRTRAKVATRVREGWEVCTDEMSERLGDMKDPNFAAAGLDGDKSRGDVVLMRIPISVYEEYKRVERERKDRMQQSAADSSEFISRGEPLKEQYGQGRDIYFRRPLHGVRTTNRSE